MNDYYLLLIPGLPLASFLILGIWGKKMPPRLAGNIGTLVLFVVTCLSVFTAWQYFESGPGADGYQAIQAFQFNWLQFRPGLSIDMGLVLDPISVMMLVVVSVVSFMVHLFSTGYMKGEDRYATYFSYLSLFTFSMLGLVVSSNLFQLYMFWELVGVSSYLLIGFYFTKASAIAASKKAFIVTRFADFGFLIGILLLGLQAGSFDFGTIIQRLTETGSPEQLAITTGSFLGLSTLTWALVLVFMGGAGKSAMFPLHIWLPDAMEGPTPVSALIHAATMVVAGVFLVARLFPLFYLDEAALSLVTWIGLFSAFFAAIIACTQTDIKRVLAYSTMSQIGFMMFALGVSGNNGENGLGYTSSMFHLFTHAFFKSLLFLGAGSIIHLVHSNELKDMGGLRKYMPVTHATFLIGCLAIAGVPPFAGFFSKEGILLASWQANKAVYAIALITSAITAFYMFRLYFSIFWSKEMKNNNLHGEGSLSMKIPLVLLAAGAILTGFIPFSHFVTADGKPFESHLHLGFSVAPVLLALAGIGLAWSLYQKKSDKPAKVAAVFGKGYQWAYHKFYIDELYRFITQKIIFNLVGRPAAWFDHNIVDGMMNGLALGTGKISDTVKGLQSGRVQAYGLVFFGGLMILAIWLIFGG